jgi:hypothetical protein
MTTANGQISTRRKNVRLWQQFSSGRPQGTLLGIRNQEEERVGVFNWLAPYLFLRDNSTVDPVKQYARLDESDRKFHWAMGNGLWELIKMIWNKYWNYDLSIFHGSKSEKKNLQDTPGRFRHTLVCIPVGLYRRGPTATIINKVCGVYERSISLTSKSGEEVLRILDFRSPPTKIRYLVVLLLITTLSDKFS